MEEQPQQQSAEETNPAIEQTPQEPPKSKAGLIIAIVTVFLLVIGGAIAGYFFYAQESTYTSPATSLKAPAQENENVDEMMVSDESYRTIDSDYGFSLTIPDGWNLWEGQSATLSGILFDVLEKLEGVDPNSKEIVEIENEYQKLMNLWKPESSNVLLFTDTDIDYKDRDLNNALKLASIKLDSDEIRDSTEVLLFTSEIDFTKEVVNDEKKERRYISLYDTTVRIQRIKHADNNDQIMIGIPLTSSASIDGETIKQLHIARWVKKNDSEDITNLISFIDELNIVFNQAVTSIDTVFLDSDNDGLTDLEETKLGTDINNPDTDGDGFSDGDEVEAGYNPLGEGKIIDTSDWQTYRNEKFGFEMKYPNGWSITNYSIVTYISNFEYDQSIHSHSFPEEDSAQIIIDLRDTDYDLSILSEIFSKADKNYVLDGIEANRSTTKTGEEQEIGPVPRLLSNTNIYTVYNDSYYSLQIRPYDSPYNKLFEEMLATFKFIVN